MILPVVLYGDPVLRQKGEKVDPTSNETKKLFEDMIETMHAFQGVGLAAQQIGQAIQFAIVDVAGIEGRPSKMWIDDKEVDLEEYMPLPLINPVLDFTKKKYTENEGCLSFPDVHADITRSVRVGVTTDTLDGKKLTFDANGLLGRAIQHEVDHLNGVLFIDHMIPAEKRSLRGLLDEIKETRPSRRMPDEEEEEDS